MAKNKKALGLAAVAGLGLLFLATGTAKAKAPGKDKTEGDDSGDGVPPNPDGSCPPAGSPGHTVQKSGLCFPPDSIDEETGKPKKKGSKKTKENMEPDGLYIEPDCSGYKFGDGMGEAWWGRNGKVAELYWEEGYDTAPLDMALYLIRDKRKECFKDLKTIKDIAKEYPDESFQFYLVRFYLQFDDHYISKYPAMYDLLMTIGLLIDVEFNNGDASVMADENCLNVDFGDLWWDKVGAPQAYGLLFKYMAGASPKWKIGDNVNGLTDLVQKQLTIMNAPWCLKRFDQVIPETLEEQWFWPIRNKIFDQFGNILNAVQEAFNAKNEAKFYKEDANPADYPDLDNLLASAQAKFAEMKEYILSQALTILDYIPKLPGT